MNPITKPVSANPPGTNFVRYLRSLPFGLEFAKQFTDAPTVAHAMEMRMKGALPGMTAADSPDLQSLGVYDRETALLLAGQSAFEAAMPRMRRLPFNVKTPRQVDGGTGGAWVQEGGPLPCVSWAFDYLKFAPVRLGSLFVASDELLRHPAGEAVLLASALAAQGKAESLMFLDPTIAAVGNAPASITFGAPAITATGDIAADLSAMIMEITTSGRGLTWILRLTDLAAIAASLGGPAGVPAVLLGVPVVLAPNAPAKQITLCDLSEVAFAASPLDAELSGEATIEMANPATNATSVGSPAAPTATSMVSLFQSDSVGYKLSRFLNWQVTRAGAVSYMILNTGSPA